MTIRVSSGNEATLTLVRSGSRAVLDADWRRNPSKRDIRELSKLLRIGDRALNVTEDDDERRSEMAREFLAGGDSTEQIQ